MKKPRSNTQVDVCVLGHNRSDLTRVFLPYFVEHTRDVNYKLWFLDNGSYLPQDRTTNVMSWFKANTRRWIPWAKYKGVKYEGFQSPINHGFSKGNNILAKKGSAPWILFINNDAFPEKPEWLDTLINSAMGNGFDAIGPVSNAVMGIQDIKWHARWPTVHPSKKLSGFCFLIRRDVFEDLGGWDEDFMNGDEDCDISVRVRDRAWKKDRRARAIGVDRSVYVHHLCSESMEGWCASIGESIKEHFQKTRVQFCTKHDPRNQIDLFYWEDLGLPPERWREIGVLPNGKYHQFPGSPTDGARVCGRLGLGLSETLGSDRDLEGGVRARREGSETGVVGPEAVGLLQAESREDRTEAESAASRDGEVGHRQAEAVRESDELPTCLRSGVSGSSWGSGTTVTRAGGQPGRNRVSNRDVRARAETTQETTPWQPRYHIGAGPDAFYVGVGSNRGRQCPLGGGAVCICGSCEAAERHTPRHREGHEATASAH